MAASVSFTDADHVVNARPAPHGRIDSTVTFETSVAKWSPDGASVMFEQPFVVDGVRGAIVIVDTATRERRVLGWGSDPSWLDGHTVIVSGFQRGPEPTPPLTSASFVDLDSGRATPLPNPLTALDNAADFQLSPNGHRVVFSASPVDGTGGSQIFVGRLHEIFVGRLDASHGVQLTSG